MHESPSEIAQGRSGDRAPAISVVGDHVLLRELVRTVLERSARGAQASPAAQESPRLPQLPAPTEPPRGRRREEVESETAQALYERFANHTLLARVRALADVP